MTRSGDVAVPRAWRYDAAATRRKMTCRRRTSRERPDVSDVLSTTQPMLWFTRVNPACVGSAPATIFANRYTRLLVTQHDTFENDREDGPSNQTEDLEPRPEDVFSRKDVLAKHQRLVPARAHAPPNRQNSPPSQARPLPMNFSGRHLPPVQAKPAPKFKAPLPGFFALAFSTSESQQSSLGPDRREGGGAAL